MATAKTTVVEVPQPPVPAKRVVLTLSYNEAETLSLLLSRAAGCPATSRRKYAQQINNALEDAGFGFQSLYNKQVVLRGQVFTATSALTFVEEKLDDSKD